MDIMKTLTGTLIICACLINIVLSQALLCDFDASSSGSETLSCMCDGTTCQLSQLTSANFTWISMKGSTPSGVTGPSDDHTLQNGQGLYIYAEASNQKPESTASFRTPFLSLNTMSCFTFWYHMYGQHMGSLTVSASFNNGSTETMWEKIGNQGNSWLKGVVSLPRNVISLTVESVRGGSDIGMPFGDIGVDDITINRALCDGVTTTPGSSTPTSTTTTTTTTTTTQTPISSPTSRSTTIPTTPTPNTTTRTTTSTPSTTTMKPPIESTEADQTTQSSTSIKSTSTTTSSGTSGPTHSPSTSTSTTSTSSTSTSTISTSTASTTTRSPVTTSRASLSGQQELWGLDETLWIIILCVLAAVILVLLVIVCVQACAMRRMKSTRILKQSEEYSNIEAYNKEHQFANKDKRDNYINAYDNMGMEAEDKSGSHPNGGGLI